MTDYNEHTGFREDEGDREEANLPASVLSMFVIYDHPRDFPAHVVVRRHLVGAGWTKPDAAAFAVVATVEEARAALPAGLLCLRREPADDPKIVEVWV